MLDALTIAALVDEFNAVLIDGRIQQVSHIDALTIGCEIYAGRRRHWLILSADHVRSRVHVTDRQVSLDPERVTPLLLLLRKYARGGRIVSVSQPRYERVVRFSIAKQVGLNNAPDEDDDNDSEAVLTHSDLIVEVMGRRSNIILIDDALRIRDSIKRVTPDMSRERQVMPGRTYQPPPPQLKLEPQHASTNELLKDAVTVQQPLDRWLVERFLAVSPLLAREILARAGLRPNRLPSELQAPEAQSIVSAMNDMFASLDTGDWQPACYILAEGRSIPAPLRMVSLESFEGTAAVPFRSMSQAVDEAVHAAQPASGAGDQRHAARRERLVAEITEAVNRAEQRTRSLQEEAARAESAEEWRRMGETIYASMYRIMPGDTEVVADDGSLIALDPALSATENAQEYFERYRKARSAEKNIPELLLAASTVQDYLNQLSLAARQAERFDDIEAVRFEWLAWKASTAPAGSSRAKPAGRPPGNSRRPRALRTERGDQIWIGRSGPQNDTVTFDIAGPSDLWLHARDMPGAHVALRWSGPADEEILNLAASLAAYYSAGRGSTSVAVDVTERRYVRKINGAGPGQVTYRHEHTRSVHPRSEVELELSAG